MSAPAVPSDVIANARAWPFEEARRFVARFGGYSPARWHVVV